MLCTITEIENAILNQNKNKKISSNYSSSLVKYDWEVLMLCFTSIPHWKLACSLLALQEHSHNALLPHLILEQTVFVVTP